MRTVQDEILQVAKPLRRANEDDNAYWNRVVGTVLAMPEAARGNLSGAANEYLDQFREDGEPKRELFEPDEDGHLKSIQTPDDFDNALMLRARGGPAPTWGAPGHMPLANIQAGMRVSFEYRGHHIKDALVTQTTTEFVAFEVDGEEIILRATSFENQQMGVHDEGTAVTQKKGASGDVIDKRSGKRDQPSSPFGSSRKQREVAGLQD